MIGTYGFVDPERLCAATFVRHVESHDSLPSTNDRALTLAAEAELDTPALIIARQQTAGRGRGDNKWSAADGALTFSLVIDSPAFYLSQRDWPRLSLATSVAVTDALRSEAPHATYGIKWPNDVFLDGRKVAGILIESPGGLAPAKNRLVIGIGVNVNNSMQKAPAALGQHATALCDISQKRHVLQRVLCLILNAAAERWSQLAAGDTQLAATWQSMCILKDHDVEAVGGGRSTRVHCQGIATDGGLALDTPNGIEVIHSGSVMVLADKR